MCPFEDDFVCNNLNCIPFFLVCNGADDCGDNTDEMNCDNVGGAIVGENGSRSGNNSRSNVTTGGSGDSLSGMSVNCGPLDCIINIVHHLYYGQMLRTL